MTNKLTLVEYLADFVYNFEFGDIPQRIVEVCETQTKSVIAAISANDNDPGSIRVTKGLDSHSKFISQLGTVSKFNGKTSDSDSYNLFNQALAKSIALDYDDYLCFAHSGHSSVIVPLYLCQELTLGNESRILAQVISNELAARLGGACLIGPLNGQLWSFVHALSAAVSTSKLLRLTKKQIAHAIALSLWHCPYPNINGFMSPDSKLLTALDPTLMGLRSAFLASENSTGPLDILDSNSGFFKVFSIFPIKSVFSDLGNSFALDTLSVKPYPGCAYIDTIIDALIEIGPVDIENIKTIEIDANALTCGMNELSKPYQKLDLKAKHLHPDGIACEDLIPTPVNITFSVPFNVGIHLLANQLSPNELRNEYLSNNYNIITKLAKLVTLRHDPKMTISSIKAFSSILPFNEIIRAFPKKHLLANVKNMRKELPNQLSITDILGIFTQISKADTIRVLTQQHSKAFDNDQLQSFKMTFPSRVKITTQNGHIFESFISNPRGGAGNCDNPPKQIADEKFKTWCSSSKNINLESLKLSDIVRH